MKKTALIVAVVFAITALWGLTDAPCVTAQEPVDGDRTLAPYFFVQSDDPEVDALPLKATSADVNIAGVIADVVVTQEYQNEGQSPLEAIYVFPGSTRAAVYGMQMTIGERTIVANIEKREEARQQYEEAKQQGKSASLLEQERPNVFQMNVANIMPGDVIVVELRYTELLVPTDGVYEFVYPGVVGPRYSNQPADQTGDEWVSNPYLHEGEDSPFTFDIAVDLSAGLPIQQAVSPTHDVSIEYESKEFAAVTLAEDEKTNGGNRDFILKYQLAGGQIESGLLLYEGEDENFFTLMIQPPKDVQPDHIPPREYIFIIDISGSMRGFPLDISKTLMRDLLGNLRPDEKFNVLLFAGSSAVLSQNGSLAATDKNVQKAINFIDRQQGGGGTEILQALQKALALPKAEGMSRSVVMVTDGYVHVEYEAFDLIREHLDDANMFAFGIGSSVNRFLIEGMARVGMGEPFILTDPQQAPAQADTFRRYIQSPVLTQVNLTIDGFDAYDIEPPSIPDVLAERPVIYFGKWKGRADGTLTLTGYTGNAQKYTQKFNVADVTPKAENAALRYLWARHRIQLLGDYNALYPDDDRIEAITNLGLQYSLLTQYTSFIAIDSEVRNTSGDSETVKQPLPLPQGVSDSAVGGQAQLANAPAGLSRKMTRSPMAAPAETFAATSPEPLVLTESEEQMPVLKDEVAERPDATDGDDANRDKQKAASITIGAKVFEQQNGVWIDTAYAPGLTLVQIQRDSQAYRALLTAIPDLRQYFEAGERVIVVIGAYAVEITPDGRTELTEEVVRQLVNASKK